jgi:hypothetical protein
MLASGDTLRAMAMLDTTEPAALRSSLARILVDPSADALWALQKDLLVHGGAEAARARAVARAFHSCLRTLESKSGSRRASRWGAALGTAAVGSVSITELRDRQDVDLGELLERAIPAVLEVGAALQSAEAWEIEARLIYDEHVWFLYEELWDASATGRPDLSADDRGSRIDALFDPLLDPKIADSDRAALLVDIFRSVLAARVLPLLGDHV